MDSDEKTPADPGEPPAGSRVAGSGTTPVFSDHSTSSEQGNQRARWRIVSCRLVLSSVLLIVGLFANVDWLEHVWAHVRASFDGSNVVLVPLWVRSGFPWVADREYLLYCTDKPPEAIFNTRCTGLHVFLGLLPLLITQLRWRAVTAALAGAVILACVPNLARLYLLYRAQLLDLPWWLAHDVPFYVYTVGAMSIGILFCIRMSKRTSGGSSGDTHERHKGNGE